jgi:8-oxo-dGTP pyrophosphatase MutT (NUDIX family)
MADLQQRRLTPDVVREALHRSQGRVPAIRDRMQRLDETGALLRRATQPTDGREPRLAAVLLLLYPKDDELHLVFTLRRADLAEHGGEISLPGGRVEPSDVDAGEAALRETQEELGVEPGTLEVVGALEPVYVPPTNYMVAPYLAFATARPAFRPEPAEVAAVIEAPLATLHEPSSYDGATREYQGRTVWEPFFRYGDYRIWGTTALVLDQLLARVDVGLMESTTRGGSISPLPSEAGLGAPQQS